MAGTAPDHFDVNGTLDAGPVHSSGWFIPRLIRLRAANDQDPLAAAARELRDRWLEQINAGQALIESAAKYDVVRQLPGMASESAIRIPQATTRLLPAA